MSKVVEFEICDPNVFFNTQPNFVEIVGASRAVFSRLAKENQISISRAYWIIQGMLKKFSSC